MRFVETLTRRPWTIAVGLTVVVTSGWPPDSSAASPPGRPARTARPAGAATTASRPDPGAAGRAGDPHHQRVRPHRAGAHRGDQGRDERPGHGTRDRPRRARLGRPAAARLDLRDRRGPARAGARERQRAPVRLGGAAGAEAPGLHLRHAACRDPGEARGRPGRTDPRRARPGVHERPRALRWHRAGTRRRSRRLRPRRRSRGHLRRQHEADRDGQRRRAGRRLRERGRHRHGGPRDRPGGQGPHPLPGSRRRGIHPHLHGGARDSRIRAASCPPVSRRKCAFPAARCWPTGWRRPC